MEWRECVQYFPVARVAANLSYHRTLVRVCLVESGKHLHTYKLYPITSVTKDLKVSKGLNVVNIALCKYC